MNLFKKILIICVSVGILFLIAFFLLPQIFAVTYSSSKPEDVNTKEKAEVKSEASVIEVKKASHIKRPEMMKAIYMTSCVASTPSWRERLAKMIDDTEINSIVIDIKDYTGMISYNTELPEFVNNTNCFVRDMKELVENLHARGIYVIGRVTVFQDSTYVKAYPDLAVKKKDGTIWKDRKGLSFIDVGATPYWDHMITLAKKSYDDGFDEINFDYIRYPSDGDMSNIWFSQSPASTTKAANLERFFKHLRENIPQDKPIISGDLFGMTTTNSDDLNIGQRLEPALKYFDYVYPMVYPSHYPKTWHGFQNPAANPGEVIKIAMAGAVAKAKNASITPDKLCPWLQDFDLGATYTPAMVRAQIDSTYAVGLKCFLLWDAGNNYTPSALNKE